MKLNMLESLSTNFFLTVVYPPSGGNFNPGGPHDQFHIWQNSSSRALVQILLANQIPGSFKTYYLKKEGND